MTAVLGVSAAVLVLLLAAVVIDQRRVARQLVAAGQRLTDVLPAGPGLAEAASVVERAVERTLLRDTDVSVVEARLASALRVIPQGVVVFDADGRIVFRNHVAAGYLAARHGEALVAEAIDELAAAVLTAGAEEPSRTVDLFGPPRRTLVLSGISLEQRSHEVGAVVVIDDITERRRLEAVRRDFVANISHELKTPVGALALLAETLLGEDDPAVLRRLTERLVTEAFRIDRTIDDLLELSRIEAHESATAVEVAVGDVIVEALDRVREAAEQQSIHLEVVEPKARVGLLGDRRQLVSAVYNLLENAVKYSDPGSTVEIGAASTGRWVDITVADHGVGIPRRDLERVFERFYRVDRARSRETGGTGLGLAIVRHIASNHAGEVLVESSEGTGSTFTLRLPAGTDRAPTPSESG